MTEYYGNFENLISDCNHLFDEQEKIYIMLFFFIKRQIIDEVVLKKK